MVCGLWVRVHGKGFVMIEVFGHQVKVLVLGVLGLWFSIYDVGFKVRGFRM